MEPLTIDISILLVSGSMTIVDLVLPAHHIHILPTRRIPTSLNSESYSVSLVESHLRAETATTTTLSKASRTQMAVAVAF